MFKTIRSKTIGVFVISLFFTCIVAVLYWGSVRSIKHKMALAERFEDLLNDILEGRRFEKNFLLYHDLKDLDENLKYVSKVEGFVNQYEEDIKRIAGASEYERLLRNLREYRSLMSSFKRSSPIDPVRLEKVREHGKALVDFATHLLKTKRKNIHLAINKTMVIPILFFAIVLALQLLVLQILSRLLEPLSLIKETTKRVARGDFSPIPYECHTEDEICELIHAFNRMAEELETQQEALVQSRKIAAIGTFSAGIAHELNNPLNNIYLSAETLLEECGDKLDPEDKELILDILNQADRAGEIVRNLLDFSRKDKPSFEELSVHDVINKTVKLVKNQVMLTGIELKVDIPDDLPTIKGNLRNLQQVFLNLLLNAIQAMPNGGKICIEAYDYSDKFVRIDVTDTGHGIKPEDLEHIFEPFYTTKGVGRGTGLGLAVTYGLVKKHGGYIEVESEVGVGTTFSVYLPKNNVGEGESEKK